MRYLPRAKRAPRPRSSESASTGPGAGASTAEALRRPWATPEHGQPHGVVRHAGTDPDHARDVRAARRRPEQFLRDDRREREGRGRDVVLSWVTQRASVSGERPASRGDRAGRSPSGRPISAARQPEPMAPSAVADDRDDGLASGQPVEGNASCRCRWRRGTSPRAALPGTGRRDAASRRGERRA